jgi:hypothetical protein
MPDKSAAVTIDFYPDVDITEEMKDKITPSLQNIAEAIAAEARASTAFQDYKGTNRQSSWSRRKWGRGASKRLRKSIKVTKGKYGHSYLVKATAPHAWLVEYGHEVVTKDGRSTGKRAEPHPFLIPAADKVFAHLGQFFIRRS